MSGWQASVFERLRDREWHQLGELFEAVETQIPLHHAMRHAMQPARRRTTLPLTVEARWWFFLHSVAHMGVESDGASQARRKWADNVRLRYVEDRCCETCNGPVIKETWTSRTRVVCLACEAARHSDMAHDPVRPHGALPVAPPTGALPAQRESWVAKSPPPAPAPERTLFVVRQHEVVITKGTLPSERWIYTVKRAFAQFLKNTRLRFLSESQIAKQIERYHGDHNKLLLNRGKVPMSQHEFTGWFADYCRRYPP